MLLGAERGVSSPPKVAEESIQIRPVGCKNGWRHVRPFID